VGLNVRRCYVGKPSGVRIGLADSLFKGRRAAADLSADWRSQQTCQQYREARLGKKVAANANHGFSFLFKGLITETTETARHLCAKARDTQRTPGVLAGLRLPNRPLL
jgi:hypothetical protein